MSSVLVAVRGEPCDDEVVKLACELLNSRSDDLYLLYVIEVERGIPLDAEIAPATAKGEEILTHVEELARSYKLKPVAELVQARQAGSAVVGEAADKNVEAIVLGIPYREQFGSFSMGETIPYVLRNAPCRVIVWRDPVVEFATNGYNA
jgi:nucleotide-binding universal stress UspA family protein